MSQERASGLAEPRPHKRSSRGARAIVALVCVACSSACTDSVRTGGATSPRRIGAVDPVGQAPPDLWVEVRVVPGADVEQRAKVEERPARFVLLPDGSLHGESDNIPPDGLRPARVRRLAREQMADIWTALKGLGFADAALADTRGNPTLAEASRDEVLVTLEVHAKGERYAFVRSYRPGGSDEAAVRKFVRSIASLAWSSDEALAESAELPTRYDLGPDPYARFANTAPDRGAKP